MATTDQADSGKCRALTEDGGRCSRPAQEDGFCYQHDESDPTVDDQSEEAEESAQGDEGSADEGSADEGSADEGEGGQDGSSTADDSESASSDEAPPAGTTEVDEEERTVSEEDLGESGSTILGVRRTIEGTATGLIGQPLDSITEVTATEDGWRVLVEVIERSSVPDTQDILGQYEVELSDEIQVRGYRRIDRYRRSDTDK